MVARGTVETVILLSEPATEWTGTAHRVRRQACLESALHKGVLRRYAAAHDSLDPQAPQMYQDIFKQTAQAP